MKRIFLIALTVFLNVALFTSCTDDEFEELLNEPVACCGTGEDPPPPPPPPPGDGDTGG